MAIRAPDGAKKGLKIKIKYYFKNSQPLFYAVGLNNHSLNTLLVLNSPKDNLDSQGMFDCGPRLHANYLQAPSVAIIESCVILWIVF